MYLDFIKNFFFISLFFISTSIVAEDYRAGKHYQVLAEPIATRDSEKIEVIEFFWFGCGHCYSLENQLNSWENYSMLRNSLRNQKLFRILLYQFMQIKE